MLRSLTILLAFQLAGEALVALLHWPLPGPVLGMILLLAALLLRGRVSAGLGEDAQQLLRYLPLVLIPPSVGIMDHWHTLAADGWAVAATIVLSTLISLVLAAGLMRLLTGKT